jgi:methionyl-tRNA formyltransferase
MAQSSKIVFFGSGPVASATLEALLPHFSFEAIITKPRPPHHRGNVPVLDFAAAHSLPVHTPQNKAELTQLFQQTSFSSPMGLVVDYGIIISKSVIDAFQKGILNSHFSLLPDWRGADPITFAVLSGQHETGVSLMLINEKMDEGELIAQQKYTLPADITTPKLTEELVALSANMLIACIPKYLAGELAPYSQPSTPPSYSRRLVKEDGLIDLKKPAAQLEREVRAFRGWPKSRLEVFSHDVIITKARVAQNENDGQLVVAAGDNTYLEILELIAPSGRTMSGADFLRGYKK